MQLISPQFSLSSLSLLSLPEAEAEREREGSEAEKSSRGVGEEIFCAFSPANKQPSYAQGLL